MSLACLFLACSRLLDSRVGTKGDAKIRHARDPGKNREREPPPPRLSPAPTLMFALVFSYWRFPYYLGAWNRLARHRGYNVFIMSYLQVNALGEWITGIYLHEFTNNEREISIPQCGIENFEFIVSERVQVNPDNSRAMSALTFLLLKLNTLQAKIVNFWVSESHGVMTVVYIEFTPRLLHHDNDVKEVVAS